MSAQDAPKPMDEVMLAMDVVDTLRRNMRAIERELGSDEQDHKLLERLKTIYGTQGIDVPDHILREGVQALREDRFSYEPTPPSLSRKLAEIYVRRDKWGKPLLGIVAVIFIGFFAYKATYVWPKERADKQVQLELTQILPAEFERLYTRIDQLTDYELIEARAEQIRSDGLAAIQTMDIIGARAGKAKLESLVNNLSLEYDLRIRSGQNQTSGVWRVPDDNLNARNYYIIVEPVSPDGTILSIDMISEESNKKTTTRKFGVRVSEEIYQDVLLDKGDDGIIQNNIVAHKKRGTLDPEYYISVLNGVITDW